jgi:hypothetical protein
VLDLIAVGLGCALCPSRLLLLGERVSMNFLLALAIDDRFEGRDETGDDVSNVGGGV